jgi:hypothetical protein
MGQSVIAIVTETIQCHREIASTNLKGDGEVTASPFPLIESHQGETNDMSTDPLTGKRRGLSRRSGIGDLLGRQPAPRCTRTTDLECHHVIRDAGNIPANAQMLCKPCHAATESYGAPGLLRHRSTRLLRRRYGCAANLGVSAQESTPITATLNCQYLVDN